MKVTTIFFAGLLFAAGAFAQTAPKSDLITIKQSLDKMQVLGSVLYIAAHPDDENTRLLAYLAQEKHYRTGYLSMTRGDGGQNLIGNEQSELLGLIRTQELLAARRVDGAEQFFTHANDFGFSKGPEETLKIWDKEKVLGDVVWVIRKFRPDVMICRFPTDGRGGHGHHTSSAILAQEAFTAAADPNRFPEQLKFVNVWQAKRLLWNTFNFGSTNTTAENQFKIDVGVYNPLLGKGYGEIAAESRSNHKTQGFGTANQRGQSYEYFETILGEAPKKDLMDGVNTTWGRVDGGEAIGAAIADVKKNFEDEHPEKSVKGLVSILTNIDNSKDVYWRIKKADELQELILACAGLWCESYVSEPTYAVGQTMQIRTQIINRISGDIRLDTIQVIQPYAEHINDDLITSNGKHKGVVLSVNQLQSFNSEIETGKITQPYWLESPHPIGVYNLGKVIIRRKSVDPIDPVADRDIDVINTIRYAGHPENPDLPTTLLEFEIAGRTISVERKLVYKYVDPAKGEIYQPVEITPAITANLASQVYVFGSAKQQKVVQVNLKAFVNGSGSISLQPLAGWTISPAKISFTGKKKGDEWSAEFVVSPADGAQKSATITAVAELNGKTSSLGIQRIRYDHIPNITLFPPAQAKLVSVDLKLAGGSNKIGYIAGAGDLIPEALKQVGYDVHQLSDAEIMTGNLAQYSAIITGVRAFNTNYSLITQQPKLMEYVKNGGNLMIQYNKNDGLITSNIGPYPFRVVNERVTDENAKVTIDEKSPAMQFPNKITPADFEGWIQERGLYFANGIDAHYNTPLNMADAGEPQHNGSLLVTDYGRGRFVYTSLAFFRELPAGVPGAYRLFVNLMSAPPKPIKKTRKQ